MLDQTGLAEAMDCVSRPELARYMSRPEAERALGLTIALLPMSPPREPFAMSKAPSRIFRAAFSSSCGKT